MAKQELKVKIGADNKPLKKGLDDSGKQVEGFSGKVSKLGSRLKMLAGAAAIGAVVKGLFNMAKEVSENADRLLDLSEITGLSTDRLQEYEHVARVAGVNSESMANAVQGLTQRLARGAEMSAGLRMGLEALNIEVFDGVGNMRDLGMVSEEAIVQLAEMEDVTKRNVIGAQLFSGAWKDLAPILALGADGIEAAKKEAQDLGLVMSRESLEAANDFRVEMETLNAQWTMMKREVGMGVIPVITKLVGLFRDAYQGWKHILGLTSISDTLRTAQSEVDDFISSIDNVIDKEERRKRIAEQTIYLQNKSAELMRSQDKILQAIGEQMREEANILRENYEIYVQLKEQEIAAAEAAAEAERAAQEEQERQRIEALGQIGRLQEQISEADAAFIAANSDSERVRWLKRKTDLESELNMLKERARLLMQVQDRPTTPMTAMPSIGAPSLTPNTEEYREGLKEAINLTRTLQEETQTLSEGFENQQMMIDSLAQSMGMAFGRMITQSGQATDEIIKQFLAQTVAAIIASLAATMGPAGLVLGGMAQGMAQGMFSSVPGYADGTNYHPGGLAWVGERGPELVDLPRGSSVMTNQESMGMMSGGQVEFIIKGNNLYGVLNKEQNKRNQIGS